MARVSTEGWIFMVGFRVFDVGLLVLWLVWFFRLRDDGQTRPTTRAAVAVAAAAAPRDRAGARRRRPAPPLGRVRARQVAARDGHRPARDPARRRHAPPLPNTLPARVRSPGAPARVPRRA